MRTARAVISAGIMLALGLGASAAQAAPELSVSDRLPDRRYVAIGDRAYVVGSEEGRFPAMGFHTRGEMGGIWSGAIKLLDGAWFGVDGEWVGPATKFTSGWGYTEMELPATAGVALKRTDFVPDGRRGALIGLELTSETDRTVELWIDAHSELMKIYPWGETTPSQLQYNLADTAAYTDGRLEFTESGTPPVQNAEAHDWAAVAGTAVEPTSGETGAGYRGPQEAGAVICPASGPNLPPAPRRCDDTAYGKGQGGRLRYSLNLKAGEATSVWLGVAGSETGVGDARAELSRLLDDPAGALEEKIAEREELAGRTRLSLAGDRELAQGIEWSKQNLLDSVQTVEDLEIREVNAGRNYPPPAGTVDRVRFLGAGWPDYPWLFGTDGEYTAFASVAVGQFEPIKDHLRALRRVSLITNGNSGKVVHEVMHDGSVFFGANADDGNTDETAKFPSAVALLWRWTGDDGWLDEMYRYSVSNVRYIFRELDDDGDGWPEGLANVERAGMGEEKLDSTVYTIRGLWDVVDMAEARGDRVTERWAREKARDLTQRFDAEWWMPEVPQHADSLGEDNEQIQQRHWIGATPMEVELTRGGLPVPGLTTRARGNAALDLRETECYGDETGMWHTGEPGCDGAPPTPSELHAYTLNTAIAAVAEGNYGRLGTDQQQRWTTANRRLQLPVADEQPGAMPEIASPSPLDGTTIDRPFNERPSVLQAWGAYGTAWPVVHQQLGVSPDLGRGRLRVVPQVPEGQRVVIGRDIRLGEDELRLVRASASGGTYETAVDVDAPVALTVGHVLPRNAVVRRVTLGDRRIRDYDTRLTNRGLEVTVEAAPGEPQELTITTG